MMTPNDILKVEREIVAALKKIYDPEIPVNIYDLGLIYEIDFMPTGVARVVMTLTAPNCPVADSLVESVREAVAAVEGVASVDLELTFEPAWDRSMLSDEAKLELGLL